jgi:nucleoside-diphosphate-sugar epimerase
MNVLITGGAGFIGSSLTKRLIGEDIQVTVVDRVLKPRNLKQVLNRITYIQGDTTDPMLMREAFKRRIDGVVHLAAVSRVVWGENDPRSCVEVNEGGTRNILESIRRSDLRPWFIFGSSREVYGESPSLPVCEWFPRQPMNIYGRTKVAGEDLVRQYTQDLGLRSLILRYSNVYGNEHDIMDRVLPRFIHSALTGLPIEVHGGRQLIDFTHINDTVEATMKAMGYLESKTAPFIDDLHVCPGVGTTLQAAIGIISECLGKALDVTYMKERTYDVNKFVGDPTKSKETLGFRAKILPEEGISRTIDLYKEVFGL